MDVGSPSLRAAALVVLLLSASLTAPLAVAGHDWFDDDAPWVSIEPCAFDGAATGDFCSSDLCTGPNLTGDWRGLRTGLGGHGIAYDPRLTQFYQGVAHGGQQEVFRYGAKLDQFVNIDGEKAGLWKGLFIGMHAESRYGQDVNFDAVGLAPVNTAML